MAYSDKVIDHYEHPRNVGVLDKDADNVGTGMVGAPACGDVMRLQIQVNKEGVIEDARFKTYGCGSAIASSSAAARCGLWSDLARSPTLRTSSTVFPLGSHRPNRTVGCGRAWRPRVFDNSL